MSQFNFTVPTSEQKVIPNGKSNFNFTVPTGVPQPEIIPKKSTLSKVGEFGKTVAKEAYKTAATIPIRAAQAEELLRTQAFGNAESKKKAFEYASQPVDVGMGVKVKPLNTSSAGKAALQTTGDILGVASLAYGGPAIKGASLATRMVKGALTQGAIGGVSGVAPGMSEGKTIKESLPQGYESAKVSSVVGGLLPVAGKFFNKGSQVANKADDAVPSSAPVNAPDSVPPVQQGVPDEAIQKQFMDEMNFRRTRNDNISQQAIPESTPSVAQAIPEQAMPEQVVPTLTKVTPEDYARYESKITEDPIFVKGSVTNQNIIEGYNKISKEVPTDDLIDMVYGVNGKSLPNELPPSAVYNMLKADVSKLTPQQAQRLLNKQPLSKAGFDLQAAKIKSGETITNPIEFADMIENKLKEKASSLKISKNSIKKFLDDNTCTLS